MGRSKNKARKAENSKNKARKAENKAGQNGHCVWYALLAGLRDLPDCRRIDSFGSMLGCVRDKLQADVALLAQVTCCGRSLTGQQAAEYSVGVLKNVEIVDGYLCGAFDPLLTAYCAAFRVNVVHNFQVKELYQIPLARRVVHLRSNPRHMTHLTNEDLSGPRKETQCEARVCEFGAKVPKQNTKEANRAKRIEENRAKAEAQNNDIKAKSCEKDAARLEKKKTPNGKRANRSQHSDPDGSDGSP